MEIDHSNQTGCEDSCNMLVNGMERPHEPKRSNTANNEEKKAAVRSEIERVSRLPPKSNYAMHRMRVLNKVLNLLSVQRTVSQDEELELLFASLSL